MRSLIEGRRISLSQFAADYGLAESQLHNWLKREDPPLAKHWKRLAEYFGVSIQYLISGTPEKTERSLAVREQQTPYRIGVEAPGPMRINPAHALSPDAPSRKDVIDYLNTYLDYAQQIPGGVSHAYIELTEALPMEKIKRRLEKAENSP